MKPFNHKDYAIRECEQSIRILREEMKGLGDKDIHNLEYILYSIKPGSLLFKRGCIRSLRKAIKLLKKEKQKAIEEKGDDTMPSIEHMRSAISDAYEGEGWKFRCEHMHQNQVIAIYRSLMKRGAFEPGGLKRAKQSSGVDCPETATDAPKFIPYTGVQLSMFDI